MSVPCVIYRVHERVVIDIVQRHHRRGDASLRYLSRTCRAVSPTRVGSGMVCGIIYTYVGSSFLFGVSRRVADGRRWWFRDCDGRFSGTAGRFSDTASRFSCWLGRRSGMASSVRRGRCERVDTLRLAVTGGGRAAALGGVAGAVTASLPVCSPGPAKKG